MTLNGKRYPCGSVIDPNTLPQKQMAAMINAKFARWEQKSLRRKYPEPYSLPASDPPQARQPVQIVEDRDVVESWRLTLAANPRVLNGDTAKAMDELMSDVGARDLYKRAVTEATQREAKRRKVVSVCPTEVGF